MRCLEREDRGCVGLSLRTRQVRGHGDEKSSIKKLRCIYIYI